ncbi:MAG: zinc ribbon domain-containing protein [Nitrosospira sp.]|nr:zinc ribbon domain-containing protein [Nitrosospira sp.]
MPTYDYECTPCNIRFETRHSINACTPNCPRCGGTLAKLILSAPATHGYMAHGRHQAMRSLQPKPGQEKHQHGPGCGCGHQAKS